MSTENKRLNNNENKEESNVTLFSAWCKKCGNCVAFCPTQALAMNEWGAPYMAHPEKCKACHLCEKLCPDFAIGVADGHPQYKKRDPRNQKKRKESIGHIQARPSYERLAPEPVNDEEDSKSDKK